MLETRFVDNGDEARSVTGLTLSAGGKALAGIIEGAHDVLSVEKQTDHRGKREIVIAGLAQ